MKCYSSYDPQFEDTSTFGSDTDNTYSYDADYIVDGIETDRAIYLTDGFNVSLGVYNSTAYTTLSTYQLTRFHISIT